MNKKWLTVASSDYLWSLVLNDSLPIKENIKNYIDKHAVISLDYFLEKILQKINIDTKYNSLCLFPFNPERKYCISISHNYIGHKLKNLEETYILMKKMESRGCVNYSRESEFENNIIRVEKRLHYYFTSNDLIDNRIKELKHKQCSIL